MVAEAGSVETMAPLESDQEKVINSEAKRCGKLRAKKTAIALTRKRAQMEIPSNSPIPDKTANEEEKEDKSESNKAKRKGKKFRPAPWLCENMNVESKAPIRSDVDDALAFIAGGAAVALTEPPQNEIDLIAEKNDMEYWNRTRRKANLSGKVNRMALVNSDTKRKLQGEVRVIDRETAIKYNVDSLKSHARMSSKREMIRSDVISRLKAHDQFLSDLKERKSANTEEKLKRIGLKRRGVDEPKKATQTPPPPPKTKNYCRVKKVRAPGRNRKSRWSAERKEERSHVPHEFELTELNVDRDDPEETELMCFLMDLQNRDLSPEDYEILLRLDDQVAPKTTSANKLASLRTEEVSGVGCDDAARWEDAPCAICMDAFENGQSVKHLPCSHFFHASCIEMWLTNSGDRCPLDGLEV